MEYIQLGVEAMYDCQRDKVMIGELVASCFYYDVFYYDTIFPFVELSLLKNDSISWLYIIINVPSKFTRKSHTYNSSIIIRREIWANMRSSAWMWMQQL